VTSHRVHVGCSGWNYAHWRNGVFYPPRLPPREWLSYYARVFDTVEVNATFYRLPKITTVAGWVERTPQDFVIAVKASRYLTHVKRLAGLRESLDILLERIRPLVDSPKLGPVLWQLPPTLHRDDELLAGALATLPRNLRHAFEFRHESWFAEETYRLLRDHGVALVVADRAGAPGLRREEITADFTYVRFHAGGHGGDGNYSHAELGAWKRRLADWARTVEVFAYFNNDWAGYAVENALYLKGSLGRASVAA
jgi:uncharacterized protein YecE (DUF72 family)